jgi:predicted HAD superfamily Cof-like phosphohydrolase
MSRVKSYHQVQVEKFMALAGQDVPLSPSIPNSETVLLRANLLLEELLETVRRGLGVVVFDRGNKVELRIENLGFEIASEPDIEQVADGFADIGVVNTGMLSSFGLADQSIVDEVDSNNLSKFSEGSSRRSDGKLIKPPGFVGPRIKEIIDGQSN